MVSAQRGLSPEAVLIFAWIEARCANLSRKKRDEQLAEFLRILEEWAAEPVSLRRPADAEAKKIALEWARQELPTLLGAKVTRRAPRAL